MRIIFRSIFYKFFRVERLPDDLEQKISATFVRHVFQQAYLGQFATLLCASIIYIALHEKNININTLNIWFGFFLSVVIFRVLTVFFYRQQLNPERCTRFWHNIYIFGALLGGIAWGSCGILFFDQATTLQQTLMILLLAGVTAGAVPLSAGIPEATVIFLICLILPFIIAINMLDNRLYTLFNVGLSFYLMFTVILSIKSFFLVRNSVLLKYENDALLINLTEAKSQLEISNKKLEQAATHDPLTQIANRRLFQSNLENAIAIANKNKTKLGVLFVDFDHFKEMNDVHGHLAGDLILITVIERLRNYFGTDEIMARVGGDETIILLEHIMTLNEAEIVARDICRLIAAPIRMDAIELKITASIGISIYPDDAGDTGSLIRAADNTMYEVKKAGGNNYRFHKELVK